MLCGKCRHDCKQATNGPGIPEGQYWCDRCCKAVDIKVPTVRMWDGEINRERFYAEQRAKTARRDAERMAYLQNHGHWPKGATA